MAERNFKNAWAKCEFKYKNCYAGSNMVYKDKDPDEVLKFNKGDKLPEELAERLFLNNPNHVTFEKPVGEAQPNQEDEAPDDEPKDKPKEDRALTESEAIELTKNQQLNLLADRGLEKVELKKLKLEKDRVAKILETNP